MLSFDQIKQHLRSLIAEELTKVFEEVKAHLPQNSKKLDTLLLLEGRYADLLKKAQRGVLSDEEQRLETNRIREQLLGWINGLEEKDFEESGDQNNSKKLRHSLLLLLFVFIVAAVIWGPSVIKQFDAKDVENTLDLDTLSIENTSDDSVSQIPKATIEPPINKNQQENEKGTSSQSSENGKDHPKEIPPVEIQLLVDALWKDSKILANKQLIEPLRRVGNILFLDLSPGSYEIQLISGENRCTDRIQVPQGGGRITISCE
jgi:hypothetical protein